MVRPQNGLLCYILVKGVLVNCAGWIEYGPSKRLGGGKACAVTRITSSYVRFPPKIERRIGIFRSLNRSRIKIRDPRPI